MIVGWFVWIMSLVTLIAALIIGRGKPAELARLKLEIALLDGKYRNLERVSSSRIQVLRDVMMEVQESLPSGFHEYASIPIRVKMLSDNYRKARHSKLACLRDQPAPENRGKPVWPIVISEARDLFADTYDAELVDGFVSTLEERDRQGRERYGVPLCSNNGRDAGVDALQECLDLCAYLAQMVEETDHDASTVELLDGALLTSFQLFRRTTPKT